MFKSLLPRHVVPFVFGLISIATACGDDSDGTLEDAGKPDGGGATSGSGGKGGGGKGGATAGTGGSGATGGSKGGSGGAGGSGGSGGTAPTMECTEDPPASPFKCGDETCTVPAYPNNPCVVPCCVEVDGQPKCGAKSTSEQFAAACALPVEPDPQCPAVNGGMGGDMQGCCNYEEGKCGIISSARPGCITESMFVEIPETTCSKPAEDTDGGVEEPDAG